MRIVFRGIAAGIIRKYDRLKKNELGQITHFDILADDTMAYIGMAIENANQGETVLYI